MARPPALGAGYFTGSSPVCRTMSVKLSKDVQDALKRKRFEKENLSASDIVEQIKQDRLAQQKRYINKMFRI